MGYLRTTGITYNLRLYVVRRRSGDGGYVVYLLLVYLHARVLYFRQHKGVKAVIFLPTPPWWPSCRFRCAQFRIRARLSVLSAE